MAEPLPSNNNNASDEIDLGQFLDLINKGFKNIGNFFLRIFIYIKRNAIKLFGLVVLGAAISYGLNQIISKKLKTDVIVRPNFESKSYLYDVVDEIEANIRSKNEVFFKDLGISTEDVVGFKIEIEAIEDDEVKSDEVILNEMKYLEVLENFKDKGFVIDILRSELSKKSEINHKITFTYKDQEKGEAVVKVLIKYINSNAYFNQLKQIYQENAKSRIDKNTLVIGQIDQLVENYSKGLLAEKQKSGTGIVYMEKENTLNVPSLLSLKDRLLKEIEDKKLEIAQRTGVLSILNFGNTQEVQKSFFNQTYFFIPAILVFGFISFSFFSYLERKAKEIE